MEQEIDIRKYALAIVSRWRSILAASVLAALVAFGVSLMLPVSYTATATVLMFVRQTGSQLGTNEPMLTVETIDAGARRQGLVALAQSTAIEALLPEDVLRRVASPGYRPGMFVQNDQIEVDAQGDLLKVHAHAATPEQARDLANAWADTLVAQVGKLYTDQHSSVQLAGAALLPLAPASPSVVMNTAAGAAAGLLVGILAALVAAATGFSLPWPRRIADRERATTQPSPTR